MNDREAHPGYVVRAATPADADSLVSLWTQLTADGESADVRYRARPDATRTAQGFITQQWLEPGSSHAVFVAEADGTVVGFVAAVPAAPHPVLSVPPTLLITDAVVAPLWRRQGIGRSLLVELRSHAQRAGLKAIEVGTLAADARAVGFWQAMGFSSWSVTLHSTNSDAAGDGDPRISG